MKFTDEFPRILFGIVVSLVILVIINKYLIDNHHMNISKSYNPEKNDSTWLDSLYFSTTILSTGGYGDILPKTQFGKIVVVLEHLFILCLLFGGITYKISY
jgi:hypothetical protein